MSLTSYCGFDEVRSALGVNDVELKNTVLSLPVYEMGLLREFNRISLSLAAAFLAISGKSPGARTDAEKALYDATRLFSVYAVAKQVGVALPNFAPKDVGDGKASISRFAGEPFKLVLDGIDAYYQTMRANAQEALAGYGVTTTSTASTLPVSPFRASKRSYDPVTGA